MEKQVWQNNKTNKQKTKNENENKQTNKKQKKKKNNRKMYRLNEQKVKKTYADTGEEAVTQKLLARLGLHAGNESCDTILLLQRPSEKEHKTHTNTPEKTHRRTSALVVGIAATHVAANALLHLLLLLRLRLLFRGGWEN